MRELINAPAYNRSNHAQGHNIKKTGGNEIAVFTDTQHLQGVAVFILRLVITCHDVQGVMGAVAGRYASKRLHYEGNDR